MTSRQWFCLALRVLAVWELARVIQYLGLFAATLASGDPLGGSAPMVYLIWIAMTTAVALALLLFAPAVALRLYPQEETEAVTLASPDNPGSHALEIGLRLLGVYFLVQALHMLVTSVVNWLVVAPWQGNSSAQYWVGAGMSSLVSGGVMAVLGVVVLLGPKRIVVAVDRLRYQAERDAYTPPSVEE